MFKYVDTTTLRLPKSVNEQVLLPYPTGQYDVVWGTRIRRFVKMRETRCNPKKKFTLEKTAAGLLCTRIL